MTDDEARRWACATVGWFFANGVKRFGIPMGMDDGTGFPEEIEWKSDADLAEAVRVWWLKRGGPYEPIVGGYNNDAADVALDWLERGPLAFIKAVREVVDGQ